jgi:predicted CXXCH cytochrome family protein
MRALIRFLSRASAGVVEQRDRVFDGESLTLGRATDQVLTLKDRRVELEHARIQRSGGRCYVHSRALTGVLVNGRVCHDAPLAIGDTVQIGANVLKLFEPPPGFDVALTFELDARSDAREAAAPALSLSLKDIGLRQRPLAWTAFIVTLLAALVLPWLASPQSPVHVPLRATALPSDHAWSSGPLHVAHSGVQTTCESCHERPFVRVRDSACLACHAAAVRPHGESASPHGGALAAVLGKSATPKNGPASGGQRCASCHVEHNEPSTLISRDPATCVSCHGRSHADTRDPSTVRSQPERPRTTITDFATDHPEFRVLRTGTAGAGSGIAFSHRAHLKPGGVLAPSGRETLTCAQCHRPSESGTRFEPVSMTRDCQRCHSLSFDPRAPERVVPHAAPDVVVRSLIEYYSAAYLQSYPDVVTRTPAGEAPRRPGRDLDAAERARVQQRARDAALTTARDLLERRTCQTCHSVRRDHSRGAAAGTRWIIDPPQPSRVWMPGARFDHASHSTSLTPCTTCHTADRSDRASDVLMPGIETCRECHGGAHTASTTQVPSTCTTCHGFHGTGTLSVSGSALSLSRTATRLTGRSRSSGSHP